MSGVSQTIATLERAVGRAVGRVTPFRAEVTDLASGLVEIQRIEAVTPDTRKYARVEGFTLEAGDVVLCANLDGEPVIIGKVQIAAPSGYDLDAPLTIDGAAVLVKPTTAPTPAAQAALGSTGAASLTEGNDRNGLIRLTPGGTGITSGVQARVTFGAALANSSFTVKLQRTDLNAGTFDFRPTGRTTGRFDIWVSSALTSGTNYDIYYTVDDD